MSTLDKFLQTHRHQYLKALVEGKLQLVESGGKAPESVKNAINLLGPPLPGQTYQGPHAVLAAFYDAAGDLADALKAAGHRAASGTESPIGTLQGARATIQRLHLI